MPPASSFQVLRRRQPDDLCYDQFGNLTSAADSTGTTTLTYDSANRLTTIAYPDNNSLTYTYDAAVGV